MRDTLRCKCASCSGVGSSLILYDRIILSLLFFSFDIEIIVWFGRHRQSEGYTPIYLIYSLKKERKREKIKQKTNIITNN